MEEQENSPGHKSNGSAAPSLVSSCLHFSYPLFWTDSLFLLLSLWVGPAPVPCFPLPFPLKWVTRIAHVTQEQPPSLFSSYSSSVPNSRREQGKTGQHWLFIFLHIHDPHFLSLSSIINTHCLIRQLAIPFHFPRRFQPRKTRRKE